MVPIVVSLLLLVLPVPAATRTLADAAQFEAAQSEAAQLRKQIDSETSKSTNLLEGLAADLTQLRQHLHVDAASFLELGSAPVKSSTGKLTLAKAGAKKRPLDFQVAAAKMSTLGSAQMPAMLGLVRGMYDSWKEKIGVANKAEKAAKKTFEKTIADLEQTKKKAGANVECLKTYNNIENYWKRQRSISHRQYHTALKIMHAGMDKFKMVGNAMESAVEGKKLSAPEIKAILPPDVVFLQFSSWASTASSELQQSLYANKHEVPEID